MCMSDFEINSLDEYERKVRNAEERQKNRRTAQIIVIVVSLLLGLIIYLIFHFAISKNQKKENYVSLDINSTEVRTLYSYVTYGTRGKRNTKFLYHSYVDMNSFTDAEKYYYAFQFVKKDDFINTKERNSSYQKIYSLPENTLRQYMELFFGPNVKYSNDVHLNYVFPFKIYKSNTAQIEYNSKRKAFDFVFNRNMGEDEELDDYFTVLDSAYRKEDGTIVLREKVVYLDFQQNQDVYNVLFYKDYQHQVYLGAKEGISSSMINSSIFDWNQGNTSYIDYSFFLNGVDYYFGSSQIVG